MATVNASPSSKAYVYLISLVAAVGGFLFGFDLSIISGAVLFLQKQFSLTAAQLGFAIGSASLGCLTGPFVAGWFSDKLGRKKSLILADVLFGICAVGTAATGGMREFNIYRIIGGIGVGMASVVSPMYIAEVAPARIRGRLVTLNQLAIVIGSTSSIVVSYLLSFRGNWRAMFASALVPVLILLVGLSLVPESPRWLVQKNRETEALDILTRVDGRDNAALVIQEIKETTRAESGGISELFQPGIRTALLIVVSLGIFQQWTGVSPLTFYAPIIFQRAGFTGASDALLQTIIFNVFNFACTVTALLLVDRVGRRPLLLLGTAGMALGQLLMGTFFHFNLIGIFVVLAMFLCIGTYAMSLAPLTWLIMSEVFPPRIRAKGQSAGSLAVWIATFSSNQALAPMMHHLERRFGSPAGIFWIFAAICGAALLFGWRMVPETKGKSIEAIGKSWTKSSDRATVLEVH
jgi:sugar porter (SP) family MFS transporter